MAGLSYVVILAITIVFDHSPVDAQNCADYKYSFKNDAKASDETKKFLNCWGKEVTSGQSDLIILMDRSGSMGQNGFAAEKRFVDGLLSRVKVAFNATRIVIATFDDSAKIQINYLQKPSYSYHKCKFVSDFEKIAFTGGLTDLRGALLQGGNIFTELAKNNPEDHYRPKSNNVIILISDGYGNVVNGKWDWSKGSDVTTEMNNIRHASRQIEVYSVAVTSGSDTNTLKNKIATDPSLYMYQPSYSTLDVLAKNIRGDPYELDYETEMVPASECGGQCDSNAQCGCNLISGKFKCRCRRGYYGNAKKASSPTCTLCPADTYAAKDGLITVSECTKCPENAITDGPGKLSSKDCHCKTGYEWNAASQFCSPKKCPPAPTVANAAFQNDAACKKYEYETKCVYQCNPDYELTGPSTLTCTASGQWDPKTSPACSIIKCPITFSSTDSKYTVQCSTINIEGRYYRVKTECSFTCRDKYYQHGGDTKRTCLADKQWSGTAIDCQPIKCPKVPIHNPESNKVASVDSSKDCFKTELNVGDNCQFKCPSGYDYKGERVLLCSKDGEKATGTWKVDLNANPPTCTDVTAPVFAKGSDCAQGLVRISKTTLPGKPYGEVNFETIGITDNSGETPTVISNPPEYEFGRTYKINWTDKNGKDITFTASDKAGNSRKCLYNIVVLDKEPPVNTFCPDNIIKKTTGTDAVVTWAEPTYTDNCGTYPTCAISVPTPAARSGEKYILGTPIVVNYTAIDPSDNRNTDCKFSISVLPYTCDNPEPPAQVALAKHGTILVPFCKSNFYPVSPWPLTTNFFICNGTHWTNPVTQLPLSLLPKCTANSPPNGQTKEMYALYSYDGDCNDEATKNSIRNKYALVAGCYTPCTLDQIEVFCSKTNVVLRRKKRALSDVTIKLTYKVTGDDQTARNDPTGNLANLKNEIDNVIKPAIEKKINNFGDLSSKVEPGLTKRSVRSDPSKESCKYIGEIPTERTEILRKCYGCPAGEFKNLTTKQCQECPPGTKQPIETQIACQPCPAGEQTQGDDRGTHTSCKKYCPPGKFSSNGLEPCSTCPTGTYSDTHSSKECTKCPAGTLTVLEGASSVNSCGSACQPGSFSDSGVEPCTPCPRGTYVDIVGQVVCKSCPGIKSTYGLGSNSVQHCQEINYCASNPCANGKNCINYKDTFFCECKDGYYGTRCENEVDDCALGPCLHEGNCIDQYLGYTCFCKPGTNGKNCENIVGLCNSNVCGANGNCNVLPNSKTKCVCNDGYTGQFCEGKISPCSSSPCANNGLCVDDGKGDYQCQCKEGYGGENCQNKLGFCPSKPCQNGGTCTELPSGFSCSCQAGYGGLNCETMFDMCLHTPCRNGGTCKGLVNDVECLCAAGFGGKHCETELNSDYDISFQARTSPTYAYVKGRHDLTAFTIALWMRTTDQENTGTPISYAVVSKGKLDDNALVLTNYRNFDLTINNATESLNFGANDGEWHHIAVTWSSNTGNYRAYKDGVVVSGATGTLKKGATVPKGGLFVVGEEQDSLGGDFTPTDSFFGDLTQLNVWNRAMSDNEIYDLASECKHGQGNTVAWADFANQRFVGMYVTEPSLGCDFNNKFREFQYLKETDLPDVLKSTSTKVTKSASSPKACADDCASTKFRYWCRSFTYNAQNKQCIFYSRSLITHSGTGRIEPSLDLYQLSCVKELGLEDKKIPDNQISASSSLGTATPNRARLFNVPTSANAGAAYWSPQDGQANSYIQVDLDRVYRVTGIATQGHYDPNVKEWVKSYRIKYKSGNNWVDYSHAAKRRRRSWGIPKPKIPIPKLPSIPVPSVQVGASGQLFTANSNTADIVRNELYVETDGIRLYPSTWNTRVTLRMEIYGCKTTPQGVPDRKSDANQCSSNPCQNGGTCYDLYARYVCVCPYGFEGTNCQTVASCGSPSVPLNGKIVSQTATTVTFACSEFWKLSGASTQTCSKGLWTGTLPSCVDVDECKTSYCSHQCENLIGGVRCLCPRGYVLGHDGKTCIDINECATNNGGCNDICENTIGGFNCKCSKAGMHIILTRTCVDVDECTEGGNGCSSGCENLLGSYKCTCEDGYNLASDQKTCVHVKCPALPSLANGKFTVKDDVTATYTCNAGFKLSGNLVRYCLPTKTWSGSDPSCSATACVPLSLSAPNINMVYSTNSYNAKAQFTCSSGLTLIGSSTITCQDTGEWSGVFPRCLSVNCPVLTADKVINGQILGVATNRGAVLRVKCNQGYKLRESNLEYRKCQTNNQWSDGNGAVAHCDVVDCGQPVKSSSLVDIVLHGGTTYGKRATYTCSQSSGQHCLNGPSSRTCQNDGTWSGTTPTCIANACCTPPVPENAKLWWSRDFSYGAKIFIECNKGYNVGGTDFRVCENNGQWSGSATTCTIVDCQDPGGLPNGIRFGNLTTYNSKFKFFCKPGYALSGSNERTCQADGKWSGTAPACKASTKCGGILKSHSGEITHSGGPDDCHWLIEVAQDKKVTIEFAAWDLKADESLQVFDVSGENEASYEPFITFSTAKPRIMTSNSYFMRVIYNGASSTGSGFTMKFRENVCGGLYTQDGAEITSPNYPKGYPPNLDCYWTVHRPYDKLEVTFRDYKLQTYQKDYTELYAGPMEGSTLLLYKRNGRLTPMIIEPYADRMIWMHFYSDATYSGEGFYMYYRIYVPRTV